MKKNMDGITAVQSLPTIIEYLGMTAADDSVCPHCGASGKVIHHFRCDDGTSRGAMSGCVQLFPMSYLAKQHKRLSEKERDYAKKGWKLNKSETAIMETIRSYYSDEISESEAESIVRQKVAALAQWRQRKYGRR